MATNSFYGVDNNNFLSYRPESLKDKTSPLSELVGKNEYNSTILVKSSVDAITPVFESNQSMFENHPKDMSDTRFKVRLVSILDSVQSKTGPRNQVIFDVTPVLSETRNVEYVPVQPVHMPGSVSVYKHTSSRTFDLTAHLISRSTSDAYKNLRYLQTLRSWTLPFFGTSVTSFPAATTTKDHNINQMNRIKNSNTKGVNLLGAPPEVLYLYGYSPPDRVGSKSDVTAFNVNRIPVVITSLNFSYLDDVDYIPTTTNATSQTEPFPVKMDVSISLLETHSPVEYEQFNLDQFKQGKLAFF